MKTYPNLQYFSTFLVTPFLQSINNNNLQIQMLITGTYALCLVIQIINPKDDKYNKH